MRAFINKNGKILGPILLVLAIGCYFLFGRSGSHLPKSAYFFDEDSNQEVIRAATDVPPLTGANGKASVAKEYKYSCDGGKTQTLGYYIKFTPEMKRQLEEAQKSPSGSDIVPSTGMLVRPPNSKPTDWVAATSPEGKKLMDVECPSGNPETIFP